MLEHHDHDHQTANTLADSSASQLSKASLRLSRFEEPALDNEALDIAEIRKALKDQEGKSYWRSLEELSETPGFNEFLKKEFPRMAAPLEQSLDRRNFMKLLGASMALGGLTACVRPNPREKLVPYVKAPEAIIPGKPIFYASALTMNGYAQGVLVENHNGRPTRLEGNSSHPASLGAIDAQTTAEILRLYDPDRSHTVTNGGRASSWEVALEALGGTLANLSSGSALRILSESNSSLSLAAQIDSLLAKYAGAKWHQYSVSNADNTLAGSELAFGQRLVPQYHLEAADVVLSLDADFMGSGPAKLRYTRQFTNKRRVRHAEDSMNRLYVVEPSPSQTGTLADHRLPLAASQVESFARQLAAELGLAVAEGAALSLPEGWLEALVDDLSHHDSVVIVGEEQPAIVHAIAHAINSQLGMVGKTVTYHESAIGSASQSESLAELVNDMQAGQVECLIILSANPVYQAPADLDFAAALAKVGTSVHMGLYQDETALASTWHIPETHELETWGDARAFDGSITIMQPQLQPFYGGKSALELVSALNGTPQASYDIIRAFWKNLASGGDFDLFWKHVLYQGTVDNTAFVAQNVSLQTGFLSQEVSATAGGTEVLFRLDPNIGDGKYSNSGWMQELPRPFSKLTWDNAALISPALAERLRLASKDVVRISVGNSTIESPVWVLPGQATDTITLHLGYGRSDAGQVAKGAGVNVYPLRTSDKAYFASGANVSKTGRTAKLASTQTHHALESDGIKNRHIVRSGTLADFKANPEHPHFVHPVAHHESDLYKEFDYTSYAWGMVIDQTVCTGCNACITACQSENNIPIVGKDQVAVGREMQWIRVDAYYGGSLDNPEYFNMPIACMHCEKAPCEPVCPVGATVHDSEGLNVMVYNRCVGTRYCSNNCPYKVRRFNFLQYAELNENAFAMMQNPDVTVRSRGVMEKCTYCIQRIQQGYIKSENEKRKVADGEVITACQSACPAQAIIFGDINDPTAKVSEVKLSPLNFSVLEELNTVPRTTYLAKLFNPHPSLAQAVSHEAGAAEHSNEGGH
ncbi:MAG: TAT-variant-translocated molybdopterin oxidoreductase [Deinococcales bacterium]